MLSALKVSITCNGNKHNIKIEISKTAACNIQTKCGTLKLQEIIAYCSTLMSRNSTLSSNIFALIKMSAKFKTIIWRKSVKFFENVIYNKKKTLNK